MIGDPWPEEPPDPFPEYTADPGADPVEEPGTGVAPDPGPRVGAGGHSTAEGVPTALYDAAWSLVFLFQLGVFALPVGLMLVAFRGARTPGSLLVAVGLAACGYGLWRYRVYRAAIRTARARRR